MLSVLFPSVVLLLYSRSPLFSLSLTFLFDLCLFLFLSPFLHSLSGLSNYLLVCLSPFLIMFFLCPSLHFTVSVTVPIPSFPVYVTSSLCVLYLHFLLSDRVECPCHRSSPQPDPTDRALCYPETSLFPYSILPLPSIVLFRNCPCEPVTLIASPSSFAAVLLSFLLVLFSVRQPIDVKAVFYPPRSKSWLVAN